MTEHMQGLVGDVKKNKYSTLDQTLSDDDVTSVWDNVSAYIEKQMSQQKGVKIPGFGTFTFIQNKLDVGNNKFLLLQRPVFVISEKFAQTHGLNPTKHHITGQIPTSNLNFSALSFESPFDRDTVESCVKEVVSAANRSLSTKRNVEFTFAGIGRLHIRDTKVKMIFYKEFLNSVDGSGKLVDALKDRPGTVDSVMSNRSPTRAHTSNTVLLPSKVLGLGGECELTNGGGGGGMPAIPEEDQFTPRGAQEQQGEEPELAEHTYEEQKEEVRDEQRKPQSAGSRLQSRQAAPIAQATGVSFADDLYSPQPRLVTPLKSSPTPMLLKRSLSPLQGSPNMPPPLTERPELERAKSFDATSPFSAPAGKRLESLRFAPTPPRTPPGSACGHADAGQELCYLCHQRDRRNIPVSFTEERKKREAEEDRLLQQFQFMKDTEDLLREQEDNLAKRHENQKQAAFNLGVSEAVNTKKLSRETDFHPSYVFQKRPLTPPRFIKQEKYSSELTTQVQAKDHAERKRAADEHFLERLEQVQLAEDLAAQRQQYLKDKFDGQEQYKRALSAQVRFKPLPIPARLPDSTSPVFGKNDLDAEKIAERRMDAHRLYREQLGTVEQRKRDAILKQLQDQKEEEDMIKRTRQELRDDRALRYERLFHARKHLEGDWSAAKSSKRERDLEERLLLTQPTTTLLHEQCDRYKRCAQCKRRTNNCGESNIWRESRYIPGSRLMV